MVPDRALYVLFVSVNGIIHRVITVINCKVALLLESLISKAIITFNIYNYFVSFLG